MSREGGCWREVLRPGGREEASSRVGEASAAAAAATVLILQLGEVDAHPPPAWLKFNECSALLHTMALLLFTYGYI